jgi:hypothetical protein
MKEERGGWGKLYEYNVELRDLCYSSSAILVIKLRKMSGGSVTCMGMQKNACRVMVEKLYGKKLLGMPRRR